MKALKTSSIATTRLNAVWSLSRQQAPAAFDGIIAALDDKAPEVRQAAANALGLARHHNAAEPLLKRVAADDTLSVRREAAAAIGRIGKVESVRALVESLDDSPDPFFQHAVIDALIRVGHTKSLVEALTHESTAVRRGALLALNHFEVTIPPERIAPMLIDEDAALREAAFNIARSDRRLKPLLPKAILELLTNEKLLDQPDQRDSLLKSLSGAEGEAAVQSTIAATFLSQSTPLTGKVLLLDLMRLSSLKEVPEPWLPAIESAMTANQPELQEAALAVVSARQIPEFDALLRKAARTDRLSPAIRLGSLEAVASRLDPVPKDLFELAMDHLAPHHEPLLRATAARVVAAMPLSSDQLVLVGEQLTKADPLILPALLNAFGRSTTDSTGRLLLEALAKRESLDALPAEQLSGLIRRFPPDIQAKAGPIFARLDIDLEKQKQRLEQLGDLTTGGDVLRGKQVFFGKQASCSACHRVKGQGALVGPNLSTIASIRSARDLLESIIFPSASIVQDFRPVVVVTTDGQIITGLEIRRTDEEVWLKQADLKETRIRTANIEEMREASASIMPQGLEQKLSRDELRDLFAFLLDLKPSPSYLLDEQ